MYSINGKIYTDASFVDEMVYNLKIILNGIVIKNSEVADANETEESITQSDIYVSIIKGNKNFELFNYTYEHLSQIDEIPEQDIIYYEIDNERIPMEYRDRLFDIASKEFMDNYEELNNYYRMLNGLPDYGFDGIYIDSNIIPSEILSSIDISIPIHEMDDYQIGLLESYGILDIIKRDNPSDKYLSYLGNKKIDIFEARTADKFDILYIPAEAEPSVSNRFRELYEKEKIIYFKRHYSLAYKFNSDYYDEFFIIMLLSQAATDLISEIPDWYIRRDIFDVRTVRTLLESYGVKYFDQVPLKYQISLVRYLNKIIKFKSCNKNIYDLINIFDYDDVEVYKYYLVKNRLTDENGEYVSSEDIKDMYELFFVRVPLDSTLSDSITDKINIQSYNTIVTEDKWWNGPEDHDYIYQSLLKKNFTSQATKYMSLEAKFNNNDYQFQSVYFLNMLFNNYIDTSDLKLEVPIINTTTTFKLSDLFILLFVISFTFYNKNGTADIIIDNRDCKDSIFDFPKNTIGDYSILSPTPQIPEHDSDSDGRYSPDEDPYYQCNGGTSEEDHDIDEVDGGLLILFDTDADGRYSKEEIDDIYDFNGGNNRRRSETVNANGNNEYPFDIIYREHIVPHIDLDPCEIFKDNVKETNLYEIDMSNRIFGFNPDVDLDYLLSVINNYHSSFGFIRGYTLEELGVEKFVIPQSGSIKTPEELMNIYNTNKEIYDNLYNKIIDCNNEDEYRVYLFTFNYLFTMEMNKKYYTMNNGKLATSYIEFIKDQNIIIYDFYQQLMMEENEDLRKTNISMYIDQVIESIDLYIQNDMKYLYYSVSTRSWNNSMEYLSLLVDYFKSYKVQFLDISGTIILNNEMDNRVKINDRIGGNDTQLERGHTYNVIDTVSSIDIELTTPDHTNIKDEVKIYNDYGNTYFSLDGSKASDKLSYISLDGNKTTLDGYIARDNIYRADLDDEILLDGGSSYDSVIDESFIDLDGSDSIYTEDNDVSFVEEYDWDGGNSLYHFTEIIIDNGTSTDQSFYADYC